MKFIKVVFGFGRAPATEYGGVEAMQDAHRYALGVVLVITLAMIPFVALLIWLDFHPAAQAGLVVAVPICISWMATKRITNLVNKRWKASIDSGANEASTPQ